MFLKKQHFKKKFVDITFLSPLIFINNPILFSIYKLPSKCFIGWNKLWCHHIWWNVLQLLSNQPKFLIQFQHWFGGGRGHRKMIISKFLWSTTVWFVLTFVEINNKYCFQWSHSSRLHQTSSLLLLLFA